MIYLNCCFELQCHYIKNPINLLTMFICNYGYDGIKWRMYKAV